MGKKKKRVDTELADDYQKSGAQLDLSNGGDSHDNDKKKKKKKRKDKSNDDAPKEVPTVSIAVPGSIIDNTQSYDLATRVFLSSCIFIYKYLSV